MLGLRKLCNIIDIRENRSLVKRLFVGLKMVFKQYNCRRNDLIRRQLFNIIVLKYVYGQKRNDRIKFIEKLLRQMGLWFFLVFGLFYVFKCKQDFDSVLVYFKVEEKNYLLKMEIY